MSVLPNPLNLVIIGGFLGSGKTTLLKQLLEWDIKQNRSPVVVMSEFGELDIDSALLDTKKVDIKKLFGGCVCCDLKLKLLLMVDELFRTSAGRKVYLETTGVADPGGVLEAIAPAINKEQIKIDKVILVYDASLTEALAEDQYMAERQLLLADVILVNRCDTVTSEECLRAVEYIKSVKPNTPVFKTVYANINPLALLEIGRTDDQSSYQPLNSDRYTSRALTFKSLLKRERLEEWLNNLPSAILRVKGFVRLSGEEGLFEVQAVRRHFTINSLSAITRYISVLVFISNEVLSEHVFTDLEKYAKE
jgi:G3E family GTPase